MIISVKSLWKDISKDTIAERVGKKFISANLSFRPHVIEIRDGSPDSYRTFERGIAQCFNHYYSQCLSRGEAFPEARAAAKAKELLDQFYKRKYNGDHRTAFANAASNYDGGLPEVYDSIGEALKTEETELYIRQAFDRHVAPVHWESKVELIRQLFEYRPDDFGGDIDTSKPERYAQDYMPLVRHLAEAVSRGTEGFRRL